MLTSKEAETIEKARGIDHSDIANLRELRLRAQLRYGQRRQPYLTVMANKYGVPYLNLSHTMNGRQYLSYIVAAIQNDFNLSDEQILKLWPLLRRWPRPDLEERAVRRAG